MCVCVCVCERERERFQCVPVKKSLAKIVEKRLVIVFPFTQTIASVASCSLLCHSPINCDFFSQQSVNHCQSKVLLLTVRRVISVASQNMFLQRETLSFVTWISNDNDIAHPSRFLTIVGAAQQKKMSLKFKCNCTETTHRDFSVSLVSLFCTLTILSANTSQSFHLYCSYLNYYPIIFSLLIIYINY